MSSNSFYQLTMKDKKLILRIIILPIIISSVLLFSSNLLENSENRDCQSVDILEETGIENALNNNQFFTNFAIQPFQTPRILFIVGDPNSLSLSQDEEFINYTRDDLGYDITIHDDNDSYNYQNYDAIVLSRSIGTSRTIDSITNASIPILIMSAGTYAEFSLSTSIASADSDSIFILNSNHNITEGLTNLTDLTVYNQSVSNVYLKGYNTLPITSDIVSLASHETKTHERSIVTLEKGGRDWDGYSVAERRAFWGAAEGAFLNADGWFRWNRTLHWILYEYSTGSSSFQVNVIDLDNKIVENARVILNNSYTTSTIPSQNTTSIGQTIFNNIPYGYYNITVEFRTSINDSLTLLEIAGNRTHQQETSFEYTIIIPDYLDDVPPVIQNIHFDKATYNFSAEIIDQSTITEAFLNITVYNRTSELYISPTNFTLIEDENNIYFNDTALDTLNHTAVDIYYNIIAFDIASNVRVTPIQSFILEDPTPPVIHEYNVTDYGNGTLEFWANISDADSAVSAPVILKINDTYRNMYLNTSDLWVYRTEFQYNLVLNYTIYSTNDTLGNENGTKLYNSFPTGEVPVFAYVLSSDLTPPAITRYETTFLSHDEGFVEFTVYIEETTTFQSGINESNIQLLLSINENPNQTIIMDKIIEGIFYKEYIFNYQDNVTYWINATDNIGNIIINSTYQVYRISDNELPEVNYSAQEYGNGTIDYFATVYDWPLNDTEVNLHYILEWSPNPSLWTNITMNPINETSFYYRYSSLDYQTQNIWYYVSAIDFEENLNDPTLNNAYTINMTDVIKPQLFMTISNSTINDGEILVEAYATDPFGETSGLFINNTISLNLTYKSVTTSYDMIYSSFFTFTKNFELVYGEYVTITAYVTDNAGNQGNLSKSFQVEDYSPPKILQYGVYDYKNGTTRIWAEVFEDEAGSGLPSDNSSVILTYAFIYQYTVQMRWNGSGNFYCYVIPDIFEPGQAFAFNITAYDNSNNKVGTPLQFYLIQEKVKPFINENLIISILLTSTISLIFLIFISLLVVKIRKRKEAKTKIHLEFKERLSFIPEIYSIVVTSGVGLPIFNVSNVLYHKDDSLNGSLSGLSVGIDSFLESFQSDFISQIEGENTQNTEDSSIARLSLIEKEHIQILIAASPSYRIFIFMKKKPPEFIKNLLQKAIQNIESKVPLLDQGMFDETLIGPQVLAILKESLPIVLLDNFIIDIKRIIKLDRIIETEGDVGQSKNSFNALKQLVMVKTLNLPKMEIKQKQFSFKKLMTNNNIEFTRKMIYTEALNIMEKLLELPYEDIFEALWVGSSSKIKIIIPLNENISI